MSKIRFFLFELILLSVVSFFYYSDVSAQTCPHPACGAPGLPCCAGAITIQQFTCGPDGVGGCQKEPGLTSSYSCSGSGASSCQSDQGVYSSNDPCIDENPDPSVVNCTNDSTGSPGSCCIAGVVSSTPSPSPTSPPPATNTPIPATPTPVPCEVTTNPSSLNLIVGGGGQNITATVTSGLGSATIAQMSFGSYNTGVATVNPSIDFSSIYQTTVTAVSAGSTAVWATAILSDGRTCPSAASTDTNITVSAPTGTPVPPTPTPTPVLCQVTTNPTSLNLILGGGGQNITASVTLGLGSATVANMAFGSYNTGVATVNPLIDFTSVYQTTVTAVSAGSTAVWATATLSVYSASLGARNSSNLWRNSILRSSAT